MSALSHLVAITTLAGLLVACGRVPPGNDAARYSVLVITYDAQLKIQGIKAIREETGLGLADAKSLIESSPGLVKPDMSLPEAEKLAGRLRESGVTAEVRKE